MCPCLKEHIHSYCPLALCWRTMQRKKERRMSPFRFALAFLSHLFVDLSPAPIMDSLSHPTKHCSWHRIKSFLPGVLLAEWYCQFFVCFHCFPGSMICMCATCVWKMRKKEKKGRREWREGIWYYFFLTMPQQLCCWMPGGSQDLVWPLLKFPKCVVLSLSTKINMNFNFN